MAVLTKFKNKKLQAASLNEVLIASVILLLVFSIAITIFNNILEGRMRKDTTAIEVKINEVFYEYKHNLIKAPYAIDEKEWMLELNEEQEGDIKYLVVSATNFQSKKVLKRKIIANEN